MKATKHFLCLALVATTIETFAAEQKPVPVLPGAKALRDIPYVENGHERQKLDLFLPEASAL